MIRQQPEAIIAAGEGAKRADNFLTGQRGTHADMPAHAKCEMTD